MEEDFDAIDQFNQWRNGESKETLTDDTLICECMCISAFDIRECFYNTDEIEVKILQDRLGMGQGCASCLKDFEQWKNKICT